MAYFRYLKRTYEQASAAWRRQQHKNPQPCQVCKDANAEVTPEGFWLCRQHKAELKALQPYKSHSQRLDAMGIAYLSKEDFDKGLEKPKKKRKVKVIEIKDSREYQYTAGKSTTSRKKK